MFELLLVILVIVGIAVIGRMINSKIDGLFKFKGGNLNYKNNDSYFVKSLMTKYERYFYDILVELEDELNVKIMPQVNLASILDKKTNNRYRNELFRNIDFGIFTKDYDKLLLLIEINDKSHNDYDRRNRDMKVDKIVNSAGIKLIKFYSNYSNKKDYVKQRIKDEFNKR